MGVLTEDINSSFSLGLLLKSTALEVCPIFSFAENDVAAVEDELNKRQQGSLAGGQPHSGLY